MNSSTRTQLRTDQARFAAAMVRRVAAPASFDARKFEIAARSLLHKRAGMVEKSWPVLKQELAEEFDVLFEAYARTLSPPKDDAGLADGRQFSGYLQKRGRLTIPICSAMATYDTHRQGIAWITLSAPLRLVVAVQLPWMGIRNRVLRLR